MKKLLSLITLASITVSAATRSSYDDKDFSNWGKLQLVENQLSSRTGDKVQLRGWTTAALHSDDVQGCLGENQWQLMRDYAANTVRLAMHIDSQNAYLSDTAKFKSLIKESIAEIAKLNMYCIVDWHLAQYNGGSGDPNDFTEEAKDFFGDISKYCADNGYENVLYEVCNEPTCGWEKIKSYAESVIPVITANQPDAIIIVDTDQWCQKILEPVQMPIDTLYKNNVIYSFHYYACSHYNFLGDFRSAQKEIPVFVSEWSTLKYDLTGPFCKSYSDDFIAACYEGSDAPQVVSWCIAEWGKSESEASFFNGACSYEYENTRTDENGYLYSCYIRRCFANEHEEHCMTEPQTGAWSTLNTIPSRLNDAWHWDYYDRGGEGVAYHDANSAAWVKDKDGVIIDYSKETEEVDVYSLAYEMKWLDKKCPWSTVENGKVVAWSDSINTEWKDDEGNVSYKSLNGGRMYYGTDGSARPDEGVDLNRASCLGTDYENMGCTSIGWVEEGEWINYTVKVEKAGYYKISAAVSSEYSAPSRNGEISIVSEEYGNLLRSKSDLRNSDAVTTFGFHITTTCADEKVSLACPWDCWAVSDAISGKNTVVCVFPKDGLQQITIRFLDNAGGVGPLHFDYYKEYVPYEYTHPNCVHLPEGCGDEDSVNDIDVAKFSIAPNPTSGDFTITLAENAEAMVDVINMAGQIVASQKIDGSATISNPLASGVYTVVVKSDGAVGTQKLIVK